MRSFHHLLMPVLRGRNHLDHRIAGLLPWHTMFILIDVFQQNLTDEVNVARLRGIASGAPRHVQRVMPVGPDHAMLLLAAVPKTTRSAIGYVTGLAGNRNYVVLQNEQVHDRHGAMVPGSTLDADTLDNWAEHLGVRLHAEGLYERTPSFLAYAVALDLP